MGCINSTSAANIEDMDSNTNTKNKRKLAKRLTINGPLGLDLELKNNFLPNGNINVGITSGASTPDELVKEVIDRISTFTSIEIEKQPGKEENVVFKLPKELLNYEMFLDTTVQDP